MNTSRPRTFSISSTLTSPSLKRPTSARPSCTCKCRAISWASDGFDLPVNTAIDNESNSLLCDMDVALNWLGWKDSNLRMAGSKPAALPLGDTPAKPLMHGGAIQPPRNESRPAIRHASRNIPSVRLARERGKDARSGSREARPRRLREPLKRLANLRIARAHHRLAIVVAARFQKAAYCDELGISCQFRGLEYLGRSDRDARTDDDIPPRWQLHRRQPIAPPFRPSR